MNVRALSPLEARALAVLVEKQATVPDVYPMSINALTNGCNQKSSRDPVMEASEAEVQRAVDALKTLDLAYESSGGRVAKFAQNFGKVFGVPSQAVALLSVLVLRGPQTLAELRTNADRLHKFADVSAVEGFMNELQAKALVQVLPRAPGAREARWMHRLSGEIDLSQFATTVESGDGKPRAGVDVSVLELAALNARIEALEKQNTVLAATVQKLCTELGIAPE